MTAVDEARSINLVMSKPLDHLQTHSLRLGAGVPRLYMDAVVLHALPFYAARAEPCPGLAA